MEFKLTLKQEEFKNRAREFAEKEVRPLAAVIDEEERFPWETVRKMAKNKLLGTLIPEEYGGAGADAIAYTVTVEELSKVCAATGVICSTHNSLCAWPILNYGTEVQKQKYLVPLGKGEKIGAFALTEQNAGTDVGGQQTTARLVGEEWVLNGSKIFITNGGVAEIYVIMALTDSSKGKRGISAFIVDKETPGFRIGQKFRKMGIRGSVTTELLLEECRIPKENLLGLLGQGYEIAMATLDGGRIGIAAQALGIAQGALDETVQHLKEREQFGRSLSKFQALQFEIADMETRIQAARFLVYNAAWQKAEGLPYNKEASMAKLFASETAMYVTTKAVQLHGGYGYMTGSPVERMMRDAKITEIYEGTSEVQRMVIASQLLK